jgi:nucleotide-binding universal stress UspA family protein
VVVPRVAAWLDADLIVAATHRTGRRSEALLASVSRRMVHAAHRPTLVVVASVPATPIGR